MKLHDLAPTEGAKKARKRVGRGNGSGHGTYSGKGLKGQKARAGGGVNPRFEGGQSPLVLRLPFKRGKGFSNPNKKEFHIVNLEKLGGFEAGASVTPDALVAAGILRDTDKPIKILGEGEISKALTVRAHAWTKSALEKIQAAGGTLEALEGESE